MTDVTDVTDWKFEAEIKEIPDAVHEIRFSHKPTLSAAVMMQRFGRYNKQRKAIDEWYSELHQAMFDKWLSCYFFHEIKTNLAAALNYQLPMVKFRDHWSDCFGWATEPQRSGYDKFVEAFMVEWEEIYPNL